MRISSCRAAVLLTLGFTLSAGTAAATSLDACNATDFDSVLAASLASFDARALWLDRRMAKWPGAARGGVFKLYHSPLAGIAAPAGGRVSGAEGFIPMDAFSGKLPASLVARFKYAGDGPVLAVGKAQAGRMAALHRQQLVLVHEHADGSVIAATRIQAAGALDDLYAAAGRAQDLGATVGGTQTTFGLWAPTAQKVTLCTFAGGDTPALSASAMRIDPATGIWRASAAGKQTGRYYKYAVDVVTEKGLVRNLVTDPYSVSLTTDSRRSYIADLSSPGLKPAGWDKHPIPAKVRAQTDMTVYELHVRDFSLNDASVPQAKRGKYTAFGETASNGMKHLAALSQAGMTDIHLLPVYDIGSVPELGCDVPSPSSAPDSDEQQALVAKTRETDCFNWGYDPFHYSAPEGSYASDPADGARRIIEFREMVMNLHRAGLRVGMDVVYNHTFKSGQH